MTRFLHGFVVLRRIWTRILRGAMAGICVSPARAAADTHRLPFFISQNGLRTVWLVPPPLLLLGKVAFLAESAVNSDVSRYGPGGPSRSLATSSDFVKMI